MRTKNSIKNMFVSILSNIVSIIVGLVAQALFIKILGSAYLGLNSLFSNIISVLAIVEMGVGNAIIFNLYKPIAEDDREKIKSLMKYYKNSYRIIGCVVLMIGLSIIPALPFIIDFSSVTADINIYLVYLLFLSDSVLSYFLVYKRSILYANQKNYIINAIHIGYTIIVNILQLSFLYLTHDYYLYLIIKIGMRVLENIVITLIADKMYPYIKKDDGKKLDIETRNDITKKIKALFFHKVGSFVVLCTDNIIISKFLGLVMVGLYSNYYLIINSIQTVISQIVQATTASVGNLLVTENKDKQFETFNKVRFLNFWLTTFSGAAILIVMSSFIRIWVGESYILSDFVLVVLVINFYLSSTRTTYSVFKEAAGIYYEDRFVPIIESIINIVASIILVKIYGLAGVFLGTICSSFALWGYSYPRFIYHDLLGGKYRNYIMETLEYFIVFIMVIIISYFSIHYIIIANPYLQFIVSLIIAIILPNIILLLKYYDTDEYKYFKELIHKLFSKFKFRKNA